MEQMCGDMTGSDEALDTGHKAPYARYHIVHLLHLDHRVEAC